MYGLTVFESIAGMKIKLLGGSISYLLMLAVLHTKQCHFFRMGLSQTSINCMILLKQLVIAGEPGE